MANISAIKLPNGTTYTLKDNGALQLTGGQVTGPVTFGDSVLINTANGIQFGIDSDDNYSNNCIRLNEGYFELRIEDSKEDSGGLIIGTYPSTQNDGASYFRPSFDRLELSNVITPTREKDAANKLYVDSGDFKSTTASLTVAGWSSNSQTVTVSGITASNIVIVSPAPTSYSEYSVCGVYCSAQATNSLTFTCSETPSGALTVNILYR